MFTVSQVRILGVAALFGTLWAFYALACRLQSRKNKLLRGPPNPSLIFGVSLNPTDPGTEYEAWADEYGPVYEIPTALGTRQVVICDPKTIAYILNKDTFGYQRMAGFRKMLESLLGRGLLWAEGESHKRQRKSLAAAFSNAAVKKLTSVFFDSTYKVKAHWDEVLQSSAEGEAIIEVQYWMSRLSLDSVGSAAFAHDFGTIQGRRSPFLAALDTFGVDKPSTFSMALDLLQFFVPSVGPLPTKRNRLFDNLSDTLREILSDLLSRMRQEQKGRIEEHKAEHAAMGVLIKAESAKTSLRMSEDEILAQMKTILVAGYDPPAMVATWALIELARRTDVQQRLRQELLEFSRDADPTWDQFVSGFPYLEAVVCEVLRHHPSVSETSRQATADDVLPMSTGFRTASGETVDRIPITKGTLVVIPFRCMNRLATIWGPDAKEFVPERWLDDKVGASKAKEISGHRNTLTFGDGPRACLGKAFALAEIKAVLSVMIRNYTFEFPNGPGTKIGSHSSLLPRPKVEGAEWCEVPLRVKRVE